MSSALSTFLDSAKPRTASVKVCPRGDLLGQHERLEEDLAAAVRTDAVTNRHAEAPLIAEQIEALETEIAQAQTEFVFTSIGRDAWSELMSEHLPTEDQLKLGFPFNAETFPLAAVAASCTSHPMDTDGAQKLSKAVNNGQWAQIWDACLRANADGRDPFSITASAVLHGSDQRSPQPTTTASLEASS